MVAAMRTCAAEGCGIGFEPISPIQLYCSKRCKGREGVRRMRAKRKNGGNGGPGGNGGGGLVEVIVTNDPQATYVPDTCYRTLPIFWSAGEATARSRAISVSRQTR
jgi:hypothetical protein